MNLVLDVRCEEYCSLSSTIERCESFLRDGCCFIFALCFYFLRSVLTRFIGNFIVLVCPSRGRMRRSVRCRSSSRDLFRLIICSLMFALLRPSFRITDRRSLLLRVVDEFVFCAFGRTREVELDFSLTLLKIEGIGACISALEISSP